MSVLACENIMCDNLIRNSYICNGCLEEFKSLMRDTECEFSIMADAFDRFMDSEKQECPGRGTVDDFLDQYLKVDYGER